METPCKVQYQVEWYITKLYTKPLSKMNLIVKMKFGSHLYGTDTENSDVDYKGVFLPSKEDILLGRIQKSYNFY